MNNLTITFIFMDEEIINRNKNINRGYRKLEVWKEAIDLYVFVKDKIRALETVPYKIKAQAEDSIYSCHSNIAEGYSRRSLIMPHTKAMFTRRSRTCLK